MRTILLLVLCVTTLFAGTKVTIDNSSIEAYFKRNLQNIKSIGGSTSYVMIQSGVYDVNTRVIIVDGFPVLYDATKGTITLKRTAWNCVSYNFKTRKITVLPSYDITNCTAYPSTERLSSVFRAKSVKKEETKVGEL